MVFYIGMWTLIGMLMVVGSAMCVSFYLMRLAKNDVQLYWEGMERMLNINTHPLDFVQKCMETTDGTLKIFMNVVANIVLWPLFLIELFRRVPDAKEYINYKKNRRA